MGRAHHRLRPRAFVPLAVGIVLICSIFFGVKWLENRERQPETRGDYHERQLVSEEIIEVQGEKYRKRSGVTTILLLGVDRDSNVENAGFRNGGQADFIRLVVFDSEEKTASQLAIDRDTMTPITILGVFGNRSGVRTVQICLAHYFGADRAQNAELTREAVSNLLLSTPIDFYASMNLDGISALNDFVGGVTVTLEDDFSHLDPVMTKGSTINLLGDQAELFVRSRRSVGVGTNESRMRRQQQYISTLSDKLQARMRKNQNEIGALYDALEPYLTTDMSRGRIINEVWAARDYKTSFYELAGEHTIGSDGFVEFHADQNALEQMVLRLFYEKMK